MADLHNMKNFKAILRHLTLNLLLIFVGNMKILADIMCAPDYRFSFSTRELGRNHMINARGETAESSKMFKQLWSTGRILVPANGWFEWQTLVGRRNQPFYITHRSGKPIFFAAVCKNHPDKRENHDDGFAIVTSQSDGVLLDIHDRRPLVMDIKASRE